MSLEYHRFTALLHIRITRGTFMTPPALGPSKSKHLTGSPSQSTLFTLGSLGVVGGDVNTIDARILLPEMLMSRTWSVSERQCS